MYVNLIGYAFLTYDSFDLRLKLRRRQCRDACTATGRRTETLRTAPTLPPPTWTPSTTRRWRRGRRQTPIRGASWATSGDSSPSRRPASSAGSRFGSPCRIPTSRSTAGTTRCNTSASRGTSSCTWSSSSSHASASSYPSTFRESFK